MNPTSTGYFPVSVSWNLFSHSTRVEPIARAFALALDVELGEPPLGRAVAEAEARRLLRRLVLLRRRAVLEVDLALAVRDGGHEDVIGGTCECAAGGERGDERGENAAASRWLLRCVRTGVRCR